MAIKNRPSVNAELVERVRNTAKELQEYSAGMDSDEIREFAKDVLSLTALQPQGEQADNGELVEELTDLRNFLIGKPSSHKSGKGYSVPLADGLGKAIAALQQRSSGVSMPANPEIKILLDAATPRANCPNEELISASRMRHIYHCIRTALGDSPIKSEE